MSCHPFIHEAEKSMMVCMNGRGYSAKDIATATGRADSTIYRILAKHRNTGSVVTHNLPIGRRRTLGIVDVQVCVMYHSLSLLH
jgi:transposase